MTKKNVSILSIVLTLAAVLLIGIAIWLFVISGFVNVAATQPHLAIVFRTLDETMEHSVKRHAAKISIPQLNEQMASEAKNHYVELCQICHAGPGVERSDISKGLLPEPPVLIATASDWKANELFWIIKNGIKMTGMPAFGPTHDDNELWKITAYVQDLPKKAEDEQNKKTQENK